MIFDCICDDIPLQMKILNMVIPILMHLCTLISNWSVASYIKPYVIVKCDIINDVKLFTTVCTIYCCNFFMLSIQMSRYICKCIRMMVLALHIAQPYMTDSPGVKNQM